MKYLPRMKSSILHLRLGGVYSDASLCLASKTLPTLDLLLPPSTDLEESLLCISLSRFEIGKEKTVLFSSSSIPSLSVSTSSFNVSKLLLTDVLLAGFDNRPTRLDSVGIEEALFEAVVEESVMEEAAAAEEEEDGEEDVLLISLGTLLLLC